MPLGDDTLTQPEGRRWPVALKGKFGPRLRQMRLDRGLTLREFCERAEADPGNYSRIERGLFAPPGLDIIRQYVEVLGIKAGSDEYTSLLDAAAVDRGQLPADILSDEQVMEEMPAFFRLLRQRTITEEDVKCLVDVIRRR
jgi:transcriptional regulator with XRE-family HTH domain